MNMLTYGNSKLKKSRENHGVMIACFDLPAGLTCPRAGACRAFCYASTGTYRFPAVKAHVEANLKAVTDNMDAWIVAMQTELHTLCNKAKRRNSTPAVRIHSSGDFYSDEYASAWYDLVSNNPDIIFYCYSKSWALLDQFDWPSNFVYIPSEGGKDDACLMPSRPRAKVVPKGYDCKDGEVLGSEDDWDNVQNFRAGHTLCLEAHGQNKGKVK